MQHAWYPAVSVLGRTWDSLEVPQTMHPEPSTHPTSSSPTPVLGGGKGAGTQTPAPLLPGLSPGGEVKSQPSLQEPKEQLALPERAGARRGSESLSDSSEGAVPAHPHGLLPLPLASAAPPPMRVLLWSTMTPQQGTHSS